MVGLSSATKADWQQTTAESIILMTHLKIGKNIDDIG